MSDALDEVRLELDRRHTIASELLTHLLNAKRVYDVRPETKINIPRCSKEHLAYICKELCSYVDDLSKMRGNLGRLLENGSGMDD